MDSTLQITYTVPQSTHFPFHTLTHTIGSKFGLSVLPNNTTTNRRKRDLNRQPFGFWTFHSTSSAKVTWRSKSKVQIQTTSKSMHPPLISLCIRSHWGCDSWFEETACSYWWYIQHSPTDRWRCSPGWNHCVTPTLQIYLACICIHRPSRMKLQF